MNHHLTLIEETIDHIETHLDQKLTLTQLAQTLHYSKYHLHRIFSETLGMTIGAYVQRRQLTEAARQLIYTERPLLEIAFSYGYESQQAFTAAFKTMYKLPPAAYRKKRPFYPLQLRFILTRQQPAARVIRLAEMTDVDAWMALVRLAVDGYPALDETVCRRALEAHIRTRRALVMIEGEVVVAALAFSAAPAHIDFLGVHPQWRRARVEQALLQTLVTQYLPVQPISMTTYRSGDKADTGQRAMLKALGFKERELLVEYGYPTQRLEFVHEGRAGIRNG